MITNYYMHEFYLTARQQRRTPITLYISFNKRRLANEGLVNLTGDMERSPDVIHYSTPPPL